MKLLVIGDFHGEFPNKIRDIIKKNKVDLVLSNGDYFPFHYRELWFKHCYGKPTELWEVIGKEKYKQLVLKDLKMGEQSIKKLNSLRVPVFTVFGNLDYAQYNDQYDMKRYYGKNSHLHKKWAWDEQDFFSKIMKKYGKIKRVDYRMEKFNDYVIIGAMGGSNPGMVNSTSFRKHRRILDKLFYKNRKEKVIFLSHNVPYDTKLDLITSKKAHARAKGRHFGSKLIRRTINKWQPLLHIGGHIHEGKGVQRLGQTLCINPGAVHEGECAIVEVDDKTKKMIKVRFIS